MTIEPVYDPDNPDQILCYLIVDDYDIPRGHYDTYDDARDAIRALQGDQDATQHAASSPPHYPA